MVASPAPFEEGGRRYGESLYWSPRRKVGKEKPR